MDAVPRNTASKNRKPGGGKIFVGLSKTSRAREYGWHGHFMLWRNRMIRVAISEVKNGMSACLRRVKAGESVLVMERRTPVARIVPVGIDAGGRKAGGQRGRGCEACPAGAGGHRGAPRFGKPPRRTGTSPALGGRGAGSPARRTLGRIAGRLSVNFRDTSALVALGIDEPRRHTAPHAVRTFAAPGIRDTPRNGRRCGSAYPAW